MHETIISDNIIKEAQKHGNVEQISLEVGELAHIPMDELLECLKGLVDWKIDATEKPSKVKCICGFEGHPTILERGHDSFLIECPKCKSVPQVIDGTDIKLLSVQVK